MTEIAVFQIFQRLYALIAGAENAFEQLQPKLAGKATTLPLSIVFNPFSTLLGMTDDNDVTFQTPHILLANHALVFELPVVRNEFERIVPDDFARLFHQTTSLVKTDIDDSERVESLLSKVSSTPQFGSSRRPIGVDISLAVYRELTGVLFRTLHTMREQLDALITKQQPSTLDKQQWLAKIDIVIRLATALNSKLALIERIPTAAGDVAKTTAFEPVKELSDNVPVASVDTIRVADFHRIEALASGGNNGKIFLLESRWTSSALQTPKYENGGIVQILHPFELDSTPHKTQPLPRIGTPQQNGNVFDIAVDPIQYRLLLADAGSKDYQSFVASVPFNYDSPSSNRFYRVPSNPQHGLRAVCFVESVSINEYRGPAIFVAEPVRGKTANRTTAVRILAYRGDSAGYTAMTNEMPAYALLIDAKIRQFPRVRKLAPGLVDDVRLAYVPSDNNVVMMSLLDVSSSLVCVFSINQQGLVMELARFGVGIVQDGGTITTNAREHGFNNVTHIYGSLFQQLPETITRGNTPSDLLWLSADRLLVADTPRSRLQVYSWRAGSRAQLLWNLYSPNADANGLIDTPFRLAATAFGRTLVAARDRSSGGAVVYQLRLDGAVAAKEMEIPDAQLPPPPIQQPRPPIRVFSGDRTKTGDIYNERRPPAEFSAIFDLLRKIDGKRAFVYSNDATTLEKGEPTIVIAYQSEAVWRRPEFAIDALQSTLEKIHEKTGRRPILLIGALADRSGVNSWLGDERMSEDELRHVQGNLAYTFRVRRVPDEYGNLSDFQAFWDNPTLLGALAQQIRTPQ